MKHLKSINELLESNNDKDLSDKILSELPNIDVQYSPLGHDKEYCFHMGDYHISVSNTKGIFSKCTIKIGNLGERESRELKIDKSTSKKILDLCKEREEIDRSQRESRIDSDLGGAGLSWRGRSRPKA